MTGPVSDPPPSGPGKPGQGSGPLDPNSPEGIAVAKRLTATLAQIELELADQAPVVEGRAA